jgi:5'-nucleotidase
VPGIAFSLVTRENFDFTEASRFARIIVERVLREGLPEGTLLNINIPPGPVRGVRVTKQGIKNARPVISEHIDPRGKAYYWIGEEIIRWNAPEDTDYTAVEEGLVSVTPMRRAAARICRAAHRAKARRDYERSIARSRWQYSCGHP